MNRALASEGPSILSVARVSEEFDLVSLLFKELLEAKCMYPHIRSLL